LSTKVIGTEKLADGRVGVKVEAAKGGNPETVSELCCVVSLGMSFEVRYNNANHTLAFVFKLL